MLAAVRLRGHTSMRKEHEDTLSMLGLKRVNTLVVLSENQATKGALTKVADFVTWGELSKEAEQQLAGKVHRLKPARKGLKSIKRHYPKGDLGYRGAAINDLIKRMM